MRCSNCGAENPEGLKFCNECAAPYKRRCAKCGFENAPTAKFCGECAATLSTITSRFDRSQAADPALRIAGEADSQAVIEGERKMVTALFADIKGSTELMEDLDPEEARAIIDPALKLMINVVHRYDGYVVQSTGDGIFALFGAPVAHEDHPQRALYAALRLQDATRAYSAKLVADGGTPLEARVGINTGEVVVRTLTTANGHAEYTPIGHTANLASRMQAVAPTGSIAITEQTRRLVEGYFALKPRGPTRLKGLSAPINVYEVTGLGPLRTRLQRSARRGLTKLVGRRTELEQMKHALDLARRGHGQIVAVMGEPGVGKSRLFFEFKATSQAGCTVLEAYSVSHGKASAYLPVIDLLKSYFEITAEDDERKRREKVNGKIVTLDRALEDTLPYLFGLLGNVENDAALAQLDPQLRRRRTLDAIKRILVRESLNQPLIVVFEDLHWIDGETQALLNLLVDGLATARILLLVNYRPEYQHQWGSKTYYTQLRLASLGRESAEEMLSTLLGDGPELAPLKRLIIERTEGNPFFVEEVYQALLDERTLVRNGSVKLTKPVAELKIPPTVQAILASRIDRLPSSAKDLLQALSVIGREFALELVRAVVAKPDDELRRLLDYLQLAEFVYEQPAVGDTEYIFKHALTQEVAYNSVLIERRKLIHECTGQALESMFRGQLDDHLEELAHHYSRSGNAPKAINYLHLAAQQAMSRSAYVEASGQLSAALDLLGTQSDNVERDRTEIAVRFSLAICTELGVGDLEAGARVLQQARELSEKIGDDVTLFEILSFLAFLSSVRVDHQDARVLYEKALGIALLQRNPEMVGHARTWLAYSYFYEGNLIAAMNEFEHIDELSTIPSPSAKRGAWPFNWQVQYRVVASFTFWVLGYPQRAADKSKESLFVARELKDSPDVSSALWWSAALNLQLKDWKTADAQAEEAIKLTTEHGIVSFFALTALLRGWALAQKGDIAEGLHQMVQCRTALIESGQLIILCWLYMGLAEIYLAANRPAEGLEAVGEGLKLVERTGTRLVEAETRRLKGELLLIGDNDATSEAAQCFRDAIEVAQRQEAKSWELRATTSLARLLRDTGRCDEAREMLSEIYNWFTEGFDTADLKDAKALLDELSP